MSSSLTSIKRKSLEDVESDEDNLEEKETNSLLGSRKGSKGSAGSVTGTAFSLQNLRPTSPTEDKFFSLVKKGDVKQVFDFLSDEPDFDINCRNYYGYTALVEATMDENTDMVQYLVTLPHIRPGDALLHAVNSGNADITTILLDFQKTEDGFLRIKYDTAAFTPDITPLMLACHNHNYDIIHILLERGHTLEVPHPPDCYCEEECSHRIDGEDLADSRARLNKFRALSSPQYICQTSIDPILNCFHLSEDAKKFAEIEPHFIAEYMALAEQNAQFATSLLSLCRTSKEVELILATPYGNERRSLDHMFPRLLLAIDYEQKSFVAHAHTQHVLYIAWLGPWQQWEVMSAIRRVSYFVSRLLILPFMVLVYMCLPRMSCVEDWRTPINKYITFVCSYIIFIVLMFVQEHLVSAKTDTRAPPSSGIEWVLIIYAFAFGWLSIKKLMRQKYRFFREAWNVYDIAMFLLFMMTFLFWLLAYFEKKRGAPIYVQRHLWTEYDFTLLSEAFFSLAFIAAFGKLLYYLQLAQQLGPLQLSLGIMLIDIVRFLVLWGVVLISFAIGLYTLYHQYQGMVRERDGEVVKQSDVFKTIPRSISSLYWSIYGYTPPQITEVIIPEYRDTINNETVIVYNEHFVTETVGQMMSGIYHVCGVIILINMLVAMMSNTFSRIQDNADCEWKFSRTKVWSMFLGEGGTLPPPFNIIPAPKHLFRLFIWIRMRMKGDPAARFTLRKCCFIQKVKKYEFDGEMFELLMSQLVQRYLTQQRESAEDAPITVNDFEALHHEMRELKLVNKLLRKR